MWNFVGHGFNERDKWTGELVLPIVRAFGSDPVIGDELCGELGTDAMFGFATHRRVSNGISRAIAFDLPVLEVRGRDVADQGGIARDRGLLPGDLYQALVPFLRPPVTR
jgi:hypothetical protein